MAAARPSLAPATTPLSFGIAWFLPGWAITVYGVVLAGLAIGLIGIEFYSRVQHARTKAKEEEVKRAILDAQLQQLNSDENP